MRNIMTASDDNSAANSIDFHKYWWRAPIMFIYSANGEFFFFVFSVELFATFFLIFFCLRTNSEVVWRCSKSWRLWLQCTTNKMNGRRQNVVVAAKFKQNFYLFSTHNNNNTQRATGYYYRFFFLRFLCLICLVKTFCLITLDKEILLHTSLAHLIISIHAVWFVICCVP